MMDIQKIYLRQAQLFLNSSLFALIPASVFVISIIVVIPGKNFMVLVLPFLIYSLFLFQNYLLNYKRYLSLSNKIEKVAPSLPDLLSCQQVLLYFDKEEKALVFLHPNGAFLGMLSEKKHSFSINKGNMLHPKEFVLIDSNENILATYWKSETIDVHRSDKGYFGGFSNGFFSMITGEEIGELRSKKLFLDEQVKNGQGEVLLRVRKGWMPITNQKIFLNPNTPYVTINPALSDPEKLIFISLLVKKFFK
ncbi:hypothetical protein [Pseudoneobacillus rhizosphaerae]|nr:hypothetical protein [Pseudoneobacillus rhizosphaerae]